VLYVIACGAPPAAELPEFITLAQADGWDVAAITTPAGARFVDLVAVAEVTRRPVRVDWRVPDEPDSLPPADAVLVAPATLATVAKFRLAVADTLAVGLLCEALGRGTPILLAPNLKDELARHPAFAEHLAVLRSWGVEVADLAPVPQGRRMPPWPALVAALRALAPAP
jgi:phosphopantothenoylcysteine synthetase/decarboxylase